MPKVSATVNQLKLSPEVADAIADGRPVVALESTIIAHGMPYPSNLKTAKQVEEKIREHGAIPATVAILNGELVAGLNAEQLEQVANSTDFAKVSRRDLPAAITQKLNGATTVASTMFIASLAGISLFVTGGIGGVHRGAGQTMDVSADLLELAQTDVAVVCAGAKAILDIGLTLEHLETHGVPVLGVGSDDFPAFYTRSSDFRVDYRFDSPAAIARTLRHKWDLGLRGGVVIANPIPAKFEMDADTVKNAIDGALREAARQGVSGKEVTPFLLAEVEKVTAGASLDANVALVLNNAELGAQIAVEYSRISRGA